MLEWLVDSKATRDLLIGNLLKRYFVGILDFVLCYYDGDLRLMDYSDAVWLAIKMKVSPPQVARSY